MRSGFFLADLVHPAIRAGLRAARQMSHCRRHAGISRGANGSLRSSRSSEGRTNAIGRKAGMTGAPQRHNPRREPPADGRARAPQVGKRRFEAGRGFSGENILLADLMPIEKLDGHVELAPRRREEERRAAGRDGVRDAGRAGRDLRSHTGKDLRRQSKHHRRSALGVCFEVGDSPHRLVVEIEAGRFDERRQRTDDEPMAATAARSAAATGLACASAARSPLSTSLHHCRRISPGSGSRAASRTRVISMLKA